MATIKNSNGLSTWRLAGILAVILVPLSAGIFTYVQNVYATQDRVQGMESYVYQLERRISEDEARSERARAMLDKRMDRIESKLDRIIIQLAKK